MPLHEYFYFATLGSSLFLIIYLIPKMFIEVNFNVWMTNQKIYHSKWDARPSIFNGGLKLPFSIKSCIKSLAKRD